MATPPPRRPPRLDPLRGDGRKSPTQSRKSPKASPRLPTRFDPPDIMSKWDLASAAAPNRLVTSYRPLIRGIIAAKLDLARTSAPHRKYLEELCDETVAAKSRHQRIEAKRIQAEVAEQIRDAAPDRRLALLKHRGEALERDMNVAVERRDAQEWAFYLHVNSSLEQNEKAHNAALLDHLQRQWLVSLMCGLYIARLTRQQVQAAPTSRGLPSEDAFVRALRQGHSTLERYIVARETRNRKKRVRLHLVRAVAKFKMSLHRAVYVVATRRCKHILTLIAKSAKSFVHMKRFHTLVVRAQRCVRSFMMALHARRTLITKRVEKVYYGLWQAELPHTNPDKAKKASSKKKNDKEPKEVRNVRFLVAPIDEKEMANIVNIHVRALRQHNSAIKAKFVLAKADYHDARKRFRLQYFRDRPDSTNTDWKEVEAFIQDRMTEMPKPVCGLMHHVPPLDVIHAQVRGILSRMPKFEGMPNPTPSMIVVPPKEQAALTAFVKRLEKGNEAQKGAKLSKSRQHASVQEPEDQTWNILGLPVHLLR